MKIDPAHDGMLLNLKRIATETEERGPLYNEAVLEIISRIERDGYFVHDKTIGLFVLLMAQKPGMTLLTDAEVAEAERFQAKRGWTREQALQYIDGLDFAERMLFHFKRNAGDED